jgi:branched-chain amino acid transport system substrate-binding protein
MPNRRIVVLAIGLILSASCAAADDTVKIGVIASLSGPYAIFGSNEKPGVELALSQIGGEVDGHRVSVIYRDVGGNNPARAKQLAQELIVRENVQYLAGLEFTPAVLALADVINEARIPFIIFNSGTSYVTRKSAFYVRAGFTEWEVAVPSAQYAVQQGCKKAVIIAADFAPGQDAFDAFRYGFESRGGGIVERIPVPLGTTDFVPYLQRIRTRKPDCTLMFMPGGPMAIGFIAAYDASGLHETVPLFGGTETGERDLRQMGPQAVGIITAAPYGPYLRNPMNQAFVAAFRSRYGADALPDTITVFAYDAMKLLLHMIEATHGKRDGDRAIESIKGYSWQSPRGPVTIDPKTRDIVQNIYIRRIVKEGDTLINREIETIPHVKDPWKELHPEG